MMAAQRREYLLGTLRRDGKIVAKDVAADLGLSEDSVRRDLRELAAEGLCQRVYGERFLFPRQSPTTQDGAQSPFRASSRSRRRRCA